MRAIGFGSLFIQPGSFYTNRFLVATVLALNGCLSLKFASNGEPSTAVSQTAGPSAPSGSTSAAEEELGSRI